MYDSQEEIKRLVNYRCEHFERQNELVLRVRMMIRVRWTVSVTFESAVYASVYDKEYMEKACIEMTDKADIKDIDTDFIEVYYESLEVLEDWEMAE